MADITMCTNNTCGLRRECYRFMAIANRHRQSYFMNNPISKDGKCEKQIPIVDGKINGLNCDSLLNKDQ